MSYNEVKPVNIMRLAGSGPLPRRNCSSSQAPLTSAPISLRNMLTKFQRKFKNSIQKNCNGTHKFRHF